MGPIIPMRLRCHCRCANQPSPLDSRAIQVNSGSKVVMNSPSHCDKKPRPIAAPILARAGKQMAHPMVVTIAPRVPNLSPSCVSSLIFSIARPPFRISARGSAVYSVCKPDGVVKTLHLLRCCEFSIITTYFSTPK